MGQLTTNLSVNVNKLMKYVLFGILVTTFE